MLKYIFSFLLISFSACAQKEVAFTVDDLPFVMELSNQDSQKATDRLLNSFGKHDIKAVGFVNEHFILKFGEVDANISILEKWLKNGHELGNHTFSHPSFHEVSLDEYTLDVLKGEAISKKLSEKYNQPVRYFRHPYLHTGQDSTKRFGFDEFLKKHNYEVAPVTVDSYDWYFNKVYVDALKAGNEKLAKEVGEAYVKHTLSSFDYYENLGKEITGKSIKHIFLCHANRLNADFMDKILVALKADGYSFISVEDALKDDVYERPVSIPANRGSWIHRWRMTEGKKSELKYPELPEKIVKLFEGK